MKDTQKRNRHPRKRVLRGRHSEKRHSRVWCPTQCSIIGRTYAWKEIQRSWFTLKLFLYTTNGVFLKLYKDAESGEKRKKGEKRQRKNGGLIS